MLKVKMQIPLWVRITSPDSSIQYRTLTRGYPVTIQGIKCALHLSTNPEHKGQDLWRVTELTTGCMLGATKTGQKPTLTAARSEARAMERKLEKSLEDLILAQFKRLYNLMELPTSLEEAKATAFYLQEAKDKKDEAKENKAKKLLSAPSKAKKSRGIRRQKETTK